MPLKGDKKREYDRKWSNNKRDIIAQLKKVPCVDCGGTFPPECMDFDHIRGEKIRGISKLYTFSMAIILEEIEKCEIVCANCHRIRTRKKTRRRLAGGKASR